MSNEQNASRRADAMKAAEMIEDARALLVNAARLVEDFAPGFAAEIKTISRDAYDCGMRLEISEG